MTFRTTSAAPACPSGRDIETAGKDPLSGNGLIDAVDAIAALTPPIAVHKSATLTTNLDNANELDAADILTYSYEVTNTGTLPLESLDVDDSHPGLSAITCGASTLAPGAMTACSATYTVDAGDEAAGFIANNATATGLACGAASAEGSAMDRLTLPICELDRVLADSGSVNGPVLEEACRSLATGTLHTIQSGDVTFRAGQAIALSDGFSVAGAATFTAEIDPDLDLD